MSKAVDLRAVISDDVPADPRAPVFVKCVYHHDRQRPNLAVYADHVYCYTCGKHADPISFLSTYWRLSFNEVLDRLTEGDYPMIEEVKRECKLDPVDPLLVQRYVEALQANGPGLQYLHKRGLAQGIIAEAQLGYATGAYTIPVFAPDHTCVNVRFRRDDAVATQKDGAKYWSLPGRGTKTLYGLERVKPGGIFVLTEGEFDSLIASQLGYTGLSFTNGKNSISEEALPYLAESDRVVIAYDQDKASIARPLELAPLLSAHVAQVYIATWPLSWGKDLSELFVNMGDSIVHEVITKAKLWRNHAHQRDRKRLGLAPAAS